MSEQGQPFDDLPEDTVMALLLELFECEPTTIGFQPQEWRPERALLNSIYRRGQEHERNRQTPRAH